MQLPSFFRYAIAVLLFAAAAGAQDPTTANVDALLALTKSCTSKNHTGGGPWANDNGTKAYICADVKGAVYWTADMDIDCDGARTTVCNEKTDCCFQVGTAYGGTPDASRVPYIVIPGNFPFGSHGIGGGQIVAVIYNGKLTYAVFADTGPGNIIGEASYATAKTLGINPDPSNGGTAGPVTYIVFTASGARAAITLAGHADAMTKGAKLAADLIQANGGATGILAGAQARPEISLQGKILRVDMAGRHALEISDANGAVVLRKTGEGPANHNLSALKPGIYFVKTIAQGRDGDKRKIVLF